MPAPAGPPKKWAAAAARPAGSCSFPRAAGERRGAGGGRRRDYNSREAALLCPPTRPAAGGLQVPWCTAGLPAALRRWRRLAEVARGWRTPPRLPQRLGRVAPGLNWPQQGQEWPQNFPFIIFLLWAVIQVVFNGK